MVSEDYTKEVDLNSGEKLVPLTIAIPVLVAIAVGVWFGISALLAGSRHEKAPEQVTAPTTPSGSAIASR